MTIYENIKQLESVGQLHSNTLVNADCLEAMKYIADKSIDMVLCDLPYGQLGTTACKWDNVIPFEPLWEQYKRVIKDNGAIVLTASQPFTSALVMSNPSWFRYEWIWGKNLATGHLNAKKMPLKEHENIIVFYNKLPTYNPQFTKGEPYIKKSSSDGSIYRKGIGGHTTENSGNRYPKSIITMTNASRKNKLHPTQKPVALLEYLIKTYTNEGETVLDNCMGSGSTGVACVNLNRSFIGIEMDDKYFEIASKRINDHIKK